MSVVAKINPRIAVVRLDNLGDHVLGAGLLPALRALHPHSHLTLVTPGGLADLYARCPVISELIKVPAKEHYLQQMDRLTQVLGELRAMQPFDLVINPRYAEDYYLAGPVCRALAAPEASIVGFRQDASPYPGYDPNTFYTQLIDAPADLHASRYAAAVALHLGATTAVDPVVWYSNEDVSAVRARYSLDGSYVVVGCGASFPYKLPSLTLFNHLIAELTTTCNQRVLLVGAATDQPTAAAILAACPSAQVTTAIGELKLHELSALLAHATLYVGPDSGPMHMAAATGIPVIELGWVPAQYPRTSRGPGTAGWCWSPWTSRGISVRPDPTTFAQRMGAPDFATQPIGGIPTTALDAALAQILRV
ncbi:MAG: glycosyltransferase family 9 protein [Steroidobacteraceae bacterium]